MLILASDGGTDDLYTHLQALQRYYVHSKPNVDAFFYKADPTLEKDYDISGDTIYVKTIEQYPKLWKKFWLLLKALEDRLDNYDYICRPNLSTFIVMDRYLKHVQTLPRKNCCSGITHYGGQPIPFPAGYLFTITPDIAKHCIYNTIIEDNEGIDDRCLGHILHSLNIPIIQTKAASVQNHSHTEAALMNQMDDEDIFMVRIRNFHDVFPFGKDLPTRLNDDLKMHSLLLKRFYGITYSLTPELDINAFLTKDSIDTLNGGYTDVDPFPHIVIDNFLQPDFLEKVLLEVKRLDTTNANYSKTTKPNALEYNKFAFTSDLGPNTSELFKILNSKQFIGSIESLTNIKDIICNDLTLAGAGVHRIKKDGYLSIHTDFNTYVNRDYGKLDRRINILIYLNPDWEEAYKGHIWLCNRSEPVKKVLPILNRCVIFNTTSKSFHGHPERLCTPSDDIYRDSIACYYYTKNTNDPLDFEGNTQHDCALIFNNFPYDF